MRTTLPFAVLLVLLSGCTKYPQDNQGTYSLHYQQRSETLTLNSGAYTQVTTINGVTTTQKGKYSAGTGTGPIRFDGNFMSFYNDKGQLEGTSPQKRSQVFQVVCSSDCTIYVSEDAGIQYEKE